MNTGPPMIDVMTPTFMSTVLASMSQAISMNAPIAADEGTRYLRLDPTSILATWGATRPMNPMVPV